MTLILAAVLLLQTGDSERIAAFIRDLDADSIEVRDFATRALIDAGETALPFLKRTLENGPSDEVKGRISQILEAIDRERRRKAFKGGPPVLGFSAHLSIVHNPNRTIRLDIEIMNIGTKPAKFVPVGSVDEEFPGGGCSLTSAHGKLVLRQLSGKPPENQGHELGCGVGPDRIATTLAPGESLHYPQLFATGGDTFHVLAPGDYEAEFTYYSKRRKLLPGAEDDLKSDTIRFTVPQP